MSFDFKSIKVLVIGDLMIDNYIMGSSSRLSPEAPVPVIRPTSNYSIAGGAANVAMNMSSLGAQVSCAGVIGNDSWGKKLLTILNKKGIDSTYIDRIRNFKTTVKQRIYSNDKQIARIDNEEILEQECSFMDKKFNNYDVIILSDYNKGVLTTNWFQRPESATVFLDPKKSFINFNQCDIITPNLNELKQLSGDNITSEEDIKESCKIILNKYNLKYIIAKRGDEGITIIGKNDYVKHLKAKFVKTPDVTGAGDTVISSISLAFAVTNDIEKSAEFAINASALAVSKPGTATVTIDEINNYINANENNLIKQFIQEHSETVNKFDLSKINNAVEIMVDAINNDSKIFWCGNGGSASQANHLSAELIGGMYKNKIEPFNSICLNVDTAFLTAWSNDDTFENIFSRQLQANGKKGDILIGLSTSGNSININNAASYAKKTGIKVISLTGNDGGKLKSISDLNINVDSKSTQRIQEIHILIGHIICDLIERNYIL